MYERFIVQEHECSKEREYESAGACESNSSNFETNNGQNSKCDLTAEFCSVRVNGDGGGEFL